MSVSFSMNSISKKKLKTATLLITYTRRSCLNRVVSHSSYTYSTSRTRETIKLVRSGEAVKNNTRRERWPKKRQKRFVKPMLSQNAVVINYFDLGKPAETTWLTAMCYKKLRHRLNSRAVGYYTRKSTICHSQECSTHRDNTVNSVVDDSNCVPRLEVTFFRGRRCRVAAGTSWLVQLTRVIFCNVYNM